MKFFDRLYGEIEFGEDISGLFEGAELARTRRVSLSAIPTWSLPVGVCASKFEHSLGVAHLAELVAKKEEFAEDGLNIMLAGLLHDVGTPPFSHASEYFLKDLFGIDHEEFVGEVLENSEVSSKIEGFGGNTEQIVRMVTGRHEALGGLVNGPLDVDNLDNTLRFGLSMGLLSEPLYDPRVLAKSFSLRDGRVVLINPNKDELLGWMETRAQVYRFVYGDANLTSAAMLLRALGFAADEGLLDKRFFMMTDDEALGYLLEKGPDNTKRLLQNMIDWRFYRKVYDFRVNEVSVDQKRYLLGNKNRLVLADEIAKEIGVEPEQVCVWMGRNRSYKDLSGLVVDAEFELSELEGVLKPEFGVGVYVDRSLESQATLQKRIVEKLDPLIKVS